MSMRCQINQSQFNFTKEIQLSSTELIGAINKLTDRCQRTIPLPDFVIQQVNYELQFGKKIRILESGVCGMSDWKENS